MKLNNKMWIAAGVIFIVLFTLNPAKKEAGETVKFRTSHLNYVTYNSSISVNVNCDSSPLTKYQWKSAVFLAGSTKCEQQYGNPIFSEDLVGMPRSDCIAPAKLYVENSNFNTLVACCNRNGAGAGVVYTPTVETESPIPIDPSREINCAIPPPPSPPSTYNLFIDAKTSYVNGGALPEFVTKANEWITSPT